MSTTYRQDKEFLEALIPETLLEKAIEWIQENMEPQDVFEEEQLMDWAESKGLVDA